MYNLQQGRKRVHIYGIGKHCHCNWDAADARLWSQLITTRQDGRINSPLLTATTEGLHHSTATSTADEDFDSSRKTTRPRLIFQDSPSSGGSLRGWQIAFGCDFVAPSATRVGLESARLCISRSAPPTIICRSNFSLRSLLWNVLLGHTYVIHVWRCGSEKDLVHHMQCSFDVAV